jgi:hypothetical protein
MGFWIAKDMGLPNAVAVRFVKGSSQFFELSVSIPFSSNEAVSFAQAVQAQLDVLRVTFLSSNSTVTLLVRFEFLVDIF